MVPQNAQATSHYPPTRGTTPMSSQVFVQVWDVQSKKDEYEREAVNNDGDEDGSEGGTEDEDGEYERPWFVDDIEGGTEFALRKQQR